MAKPTVRDIHEFVTTLLRVASDLREGASAKPVEGYSSPVVPTSVTGMLSHAASIEGIATSLRELIPNDKVEVEDDT